MVSVFAHIGMFGILAWFAWWPFWLVITFLTPRSLLKKYFKSPHFNSGELIFFGSFPGVFYRTIVFGRLFLTPNAVIGRNLEGFVEDAPRWYRVTVIVFTVGFIGHFLLAAISMTGVYIWDMWLS